jgi:uncharacterized protein (TIGR03067 family)
MRARLLGFGLAALLTLASVVPAGDVKGDRGKLQGKWIAEKEGKKAHLTFDKNTFTIKLFAENQSIKGTFQVDAAKKPKEIDMTVTDADGTQARYKDKTSKGIYELQGDTWKWCANEPGRDERPSEFTEKQGDRKFLLLEFKRTK